MGILGMLNRDDRTKATAREAMKEARSGKGGSDGSALQRMVEMFRDIGLDGKLTFSSAQDVAKRAQRGRARKRPEKAVRRLVRRHRRGVTIAGFLTGLGGIFTLPVLLPTNVVEFYAQSTRMVGAIAVVRGYDLDDEEIRVRVLASLLGEESGDVLKNIGLGPIAGAATRTVAKRLPRSTESAVASAIGGRILRKFGLWSARLFGKAIPGLGGVLGAIADRAQLNKIAKAAQRTFPPVR